MDVRFADLKAIKYAAMAEQADAADLKSAGSDTVWVRLPLAAFSYFSEHTRFIGVVRNRLYAMVNGSNSASK